MGTSVRNGLRGFLGLCLETLLSLTLLVLLFPPLFGVWLLNEVARAVVRVMLWLSSEPGVELVADGADGIWAYTTPGNCRNVLILYIYKGPVSLDTFRRLYEERILNYVEPRSRSRPYAKLQKVFCQRYGYCCWAPASNFDIRNHVREVHGEGGVMGERELFELLAGLGEDMPGGEYPQWEEILVPNFVYDVPDGSPRSARIYRSHHAYMDGGSNLLMTGTCMTGKGDPGFPYMVDPMAPLRLSACQKAGYWVRSIVLGSSRLVRTLVASSHIKSSFLVRAFAGRQRLGWSPPIPLALLKRIKSRTGVSLPSILCTLGLEALRETEATFGREGSGETETVGLVGAMLPYPSIRPTNRFTVINFRSGRGEGGLEGARRRSAEMRRAVEGPEGWVNYTIFRLVGKFPGFVIQGVMSGGTTPVLYSNVPWAGRRVGLWGSEVEEVGGWMPLLTTAGVGMSTVSYSDMVRFCVICDADCVSDKELDFLVRETVNQARLLGNLADSSGTEDGIRV